MKPGVVKYVFLCMRLLLGAVFVAASIDKIAHPAAFAAIVRNYEILPAVLVNIVAIVLPWVEALVGALLICDWWLPGAAVAASVLLTVFFAALVSTVARGMNTQCGCFSTSAVEAVNSAWYLTRDLFLLLLSATVTVRVFRMRRR